MDVAALTRCRMWMLSPGFHLLVLVWLSVLQEDQYGWRAALAQGSDAGTLYLDQRELEVKWIAGNASLNDAKCGSLDGCSDPCSRLQCYPLTGEQPQCTTVDNNQFFHLCRSDACQSKMKVDYTKGFVTLPPPASTTLSTEVARDICLQRLLDSTFQALAVPANYSDLFFGSTSGALRQFPGREQDETQCTSFDPRWRPWYMNGISVSRDLKVLVDVGNGMGNHVIPDYYRDIGATYLDVAKSLTLGLLHTASAGDDVEVFSFDNSTAISLGGTFRVNSTSFDFLSPYGYSELGPLVTDVKKLTQSSRMSELSNLNGAILQAASSFNQLKSLKVLVVLSNGLFMVNSTTFPSAALRSNRAKLMVYKLPTNDDGGDTFLLKTSFQKDVCSVQGSFELLDALATLNPLYSMRRYFTYLAGVQLSAVGGQVSWSNAYASVSQDLKAITPTYPAFGSDGLLIGVGGSDVVIDKLDEQLRKLVLQDFSRRKRGTLQAPANVSMTCFYQTAPAKLVCPNSTPPSSSAICPRNDTSSTLAERTCCGTCGSTPSTGGTGFTPSTGETGLTTEQRVGIIVGGALLVIIAVFVICWRWPRCRKKVPCGSTPKPLSPRPYPPFPDEADQVSNNRISVPGVGVGTDN